MNTSALDLRVLAQEVRITSPATGDALERVQDSVNLLNKTLEGMLTTSPSGNKYLDLTKAAAGTLGDTAIDRTSANAVNITVTDLGSLQITAANIADATITATQIANLTITGAQIANATITNLQINDISADKINAGTLKVGGGAGKPGVIEVYDGTPAVVGKLGLVEGGSYGAQFSKLWVGGTVGDVSTAPFYVDNSGNVVIDNTGLATKATFKLVLNSTTTTLSNELNGSIVEVFKAEDATCNVRWSTHYLSISATTHQSVYLGAVDLVHGQLILSDAGTDTAEITLDAVDGTVNALGGFKVGSSVGLASFSGAVSNITIVKGIVTAAS
jgi:hypothetical protein